MNIINSLNVLGRNYSNSDLVCKILRSLLKTWEAKVKVIQEAKELTKLPLEELLKSLMTHEISMGEQDEDQRKKKSIILKCSTYDDEKEEEEKASANEDIALITRKFKSFLMKKQRKDLKNDSFKKKKRSQSYARSARSLCIRT